MLSPQLLSLLASVTALCCRPEISWAAHPPASRVPDPWRQGVRLAAQNVAAVDVSDDAKFVGVTTMAFRENNNFWLLSSEGKVLSGRNVAPWAPMQVAVLPGGKTCGVGLAYSRITDPAPSISVFRSDAPEETVLVDVYWDLGWLRYGAGDWRTGWPASILGDLIVRSGDGLVTVIAHGGARRFSADGQVQVYPDTCERPFRMAASADGQVIAYGFLTPDAKGLDQHNRGRLHLPRAYLSAGNPQTSAAIWARAPSEDPLPEVPRPPEPAEDFPELSAAFRTKPLALLPFRLPYSLALSGDGAIAAVTEYGGWLRVKQERGIGTWNPDHPVPFVPRQRGRLRIFDSLGVEMVQVELPSEGLFDVHVDRQGKTAWLAPASWFSRGLAGCSWLPTDPDAREIHVFDIQNRTWLAHQEFPDAINDLAIHPGGQRGLASCWNGKIYLVGRDGADLAQVDAGDAARLFWSAEGNLAVAGTQRGEVLGLNADGKLQWRTALPVADSAPLGEPLGPVFPDVPIYQVGRTGAEHAYVGDNWLIKTDEGALRIDCGGVSAIPITLRRMRAAGVDPDQAQTILLSHTHGDHAGAAYLWRAMGSKIVAPETAALTAGWLMPTWSDYSIWVPTLIDVPLPLKRLGDETEISAAGLKIRCVFVPGHSFDSVVYLLEVAGKRVAFTGDIGFEKETHILHRCWGDEQAARGVVGVLRQQVLTYRPDYVFTGHSVHRDGTAFLESLIERTEAALGGK